ncbi:hypothetical protein [Paraburkholderia metrosideri]|nr:hypothetical protein [Paraburkholderia metrosideri]
MVFDLEGEINHVRHALSWPFERAKETFDAYMERVIALDQSEVPRDDASSVRRDELQSALLATYPVTENCQDSTFRSYQVDACTHLARAEEARRQGNHEEAWFFISVAKEYMGRSNGYYEVMSHVNMKKSRASQGGRQKARNLEEKMRQLYIQLLGTLAPQDGWSSKVEAVKSVSAVATIALETLGNPIEDSYAKLSDLLTVDKDVNAALTTTMRNSR